MGIIMSVNRLGYFGANFISIIIFILEIILHYYQLVDLIWSDFSLLLDGCNVPSFIIRTNLIDS